ncbi:MAG TPA: autoinducer binding domain-containing protein [Burkholderiaceae bacterium]|nr:autoinducer binding domain-containing protein [Burkholderiaceae bacterium]
MSTQGPLLTGSTAEEVFLSIALIAQDLGFQFCTHGVRVPIPITRPRTIYVSNYPPDWQSRYNEQKYMDIDPTVAHGMRSSEPVVWSDEFFAKTPQLWQEARQHGICHGWAISRRDAEGAFSMLVLARPEPAITGEELAGKEWHMRQLADMSHVGMKRFLLNADTVPANPKLSEREVDVLRWTADGKTAGEVAEIIGISERTVNFHINQAVAKLQASNKINAAVRAAMSGLLW